MPESIEELYVSIGADVAPLLKDTKKGVSEAEKELEKFRRSGKGAFGQTATAANKNISVFKRLTDGIKRLVTILRIVAIATTAFTVAMKLFPSLGDKFGGRLKTISEKAAIFSKTLLPLITNVGRFGKAIGTISGIAKFAGILTAVTAGAAALAAVVATKLTAAFVGFFTKIGKLAIDANAKFETFTTQFQTLLGSTGAAQNRIDELAKFGIETPFELSEIVEASRVLQVLGGSALATGDNLRMVGDIAAGVNQPFNDVALWVGRMYDAMQSGRPFGEASARLQEMGALSGVARAELERMQKEGASGAELWAKFNELVGSRFAGNMERLSGTFQGVTSNLIDFRDNLIRVGGGKLFEGVKEDAERLLNILSDAKKSNSIENVARSLGEAASIITKIATSPLLDSLENIDPETLDDLANSLNDASAALSELTGGKLALDLNGLINTLTILIDTFTIITNKINSLETSTGGFISFVEIMKEAIIILLGPIAQLIDGLFNLNSIVEQITGTALVDFSRQAAEASETDFQRMIKQREAEAERLQKLAESYDSGETAPGTTPEITPEIDEQAEKAKEIIRDVGREMLDLQAETNAALEENLQEHTDTMAQIEADGAKERLEINKKFDKELADSQQDILDRAKEDLKQLEEETDRDLAERRKDANKEEFRETEDHLTDMRRLRLSFLDNLEDAVKDRDAGRVRDLQRQFQRESQERQQDFETNRSREQQDTQDELSEVTRREQMRAQEIIDKRTRALDEVEKRVSEGRERELTALDEKLAQEREKENIRFMEQQAELENALNARLETLAKELSDMEELEADSAQRILETLNEYFGAGGNIDQLMNDFEARRKKTLTLEIGFEERRQESRERGRSNAQAALNQGRQFRGGSVPSFQSGGTLLATRPTLAQFGEVPELVQFTPLSKMGAMGGGGGQRLEVDVKLSGSAPPGIRSADRDAIAGVLVNALREAGVNVKPGR